MRVADPKIRVSEGRRYKRSRRVSRKIGWGFNANRRVFGDAAGSGGRAPAIRANDVDTAKRSGVPKGVVTLRGRTDTTLLAGAGAGTAAQQDHGADAASPEPW